MGLKLPFGLSGKDTGYKRLSTDDKSTIRRMYYREKATMSEIADEIGCHVSTVSRFLDGEDERRQRAEEEERKKDPLGAIMRQAQQTALNDPTIAAKVQKAAEKKLLATLGDTEDSAAFPDSTKGFVASLVRDVTRSPELIGLLGRFIPESDAHKIANQLLAERNHLVNVSNALATKLQELGVDPRSVIPAEQRPALTEQAAGAPSIQEEKPVQQPPAQLSLDEIMGLAPLMPHFERWIQLSPDQAAAEAAPLISSGQVPAKVLDITGEQLRQALSSDVASMLVPEGLRSALLSPEGQAWYEAFRQVVARLDGAMEEKG